MKIAVASQNFRTVTPHAGRTRRFLVYAAGSDGVIAEVQRLDLPKELAMHDFHGQGAHPLDAMDLLIVGSCGEGFVRRLSERGVRVVTTDETDPITAVRAVVDTADESRAASPCGCGHAHAHAHAHGHDHGHNHGHGHGHGHAHQHMHGAARRRETG